MREFNPSTKSKIAVVTWETGEAKFINMLLSPSHILKVKIDKIVAKKQEDGEEEL